MAASEGALQSVVLLLEAAAGRLGFRVQGLGLGVGNNY